MMMNHETRSDAGGGDDGRMLLVQKPKGWTSFDVVKKVRHLMGARKAGHAGTLDPLATGLLIICTGKKTKDLSGFVGLDKEYLVRMRLGGSTASYDAATPVEKWKPTEQLTDGQIKVVLQRFVGPQEQLPPMFSAAKVGGKRLYQYARKGMEIERPMREIVIRSITPVEIAIPEVVVRVVCTKGTYIRTLVHDIGTTLGCGAYVLELERTRIGDWMLRDALTLDQITQQQGA